MSIGTNRVCHIAFVTKDIHKITENWAHFLGIEKPAVWAVPSKEEAPALTFGKLEDYKGCLISVIEFDNVKMEIVQPGEEPNPWKLSMEKNGEGFQHISFIVPEKEKAEETLKELGAESYYHIGYYPDGTYSFYDTKEILGLEVNIKYDADNRDIIKNLLK